MVSHSPNRTSLSLVRHPSFAERNNAHAMAGMGIISPPSAARRSSGMAPAASAGRPRSNLFSLLKRDSISSTAELYDGEGSRSSKQREKEKKRWTKRASRKAPPPPIREEPERECAQERDGREESPEFDFELDWERIRTLPRVRLVPPEDEGEPIMLYPIPHPSSLLSSASQAVSPPSLLSATIAASSEASDPSALPSSSPAAPVCPPEGVTPNSLTHATFASSQHSHWVGMSDQFILPPPVFSRRTAGALSAGGPGGSPTRGRGVVMPKTRRQVEADRGKRMSMVQHRKRESLEIMRNALLPPLEEATQSPPNVMLPPLEVEETQEQEMENGNKEKEQGDGEEDLTLAQVRLKSSASTATIRRVPVKDAIGAAKSPELPYAIERHETAPNALQLGLEAAFESVPPKLVQRASTVPSVPIVHPHILDTLARESMAPAAQSQPIIEHAPPPAAPSAPAPSAQGPAETASTRKKRSLSLSASLARSKSNQIPSVAPPLPSVPVSAVPKTVMKKQRSLKKLFFPSASEAGSYVSPPPVPVLPSTGTAAAAAAAGLAQLPDTNKRLAKQESQRRRESSMSPITAMNREGDIDQGREQLGSSSTGNILAKTARARSKSFKARPKRPDLVISVHQASGKPLSSAAGEMIGDPEPITPALTTASTVAPSAAVQTPQKTVMQLEETAHKGQQKDKEKEGGMRNLTKRFSLGNMSAAFKRKSVPNLSSAAAAATEMSRQGSASSTATASSAEDVPDVPSIPFAYQRRGGKSRDFAHVHTSSQPAQAANTRAVARGSAVWPISPSATPLDRRRSFDTLPASESTFPPTILQLLPSPYIRVQDSSPPAQSTLRNSNAIPLERDRSSTAEYRDKRRGSRFDFDFDTAFDFSSFNPTPPPAQAGQVSPRTRTVASNMSISPALASSEGNCLDSSPGYQSSPGQAACSQAHSSAGHEDVRRESWANGALSTESAEGLLDGEGEPVCAEESADETGSQLQGARAEAGSRTFFEFDEDEWDNELAETGTMSIVHAQILPASPKSNRPTYESMQPHVHLSQVASARVTQVEPAYSGFGKRQSVQALVMSSASVDGHGLLDAIDGASRLRAESTTDAAPYSGAEALGSASGATSTADPSKSSTARRSSRPHPAVARRDTEPIVKMSAPMVIDLRGQYARRFTQPVVRTGSLPASSAVRVIDSSTGPPLPEVPMSAPPMRPTMVPLKDNSQSHSHSHSPTSTWTGEWSSPPPACMQRRSSEEMAELASQQTAIHMSTMAQSSTHGESMSRSDSASSASTQVIPTTPSSLALLRMMEPDALSLDDLVRTAVEDGVARGEEFASQVPVSRIRQSAFPIDQMTPDVLTSGDATIAPNDHTIDYDPEMDRLVAELEGGDVNVQVAIAVSHSVLMGSTISASDIASMAHLADVVDSPHSARNVTSTVVSKQYPTRDDAGVDGIPEAAMPFTTPEAGLDSMSDSSSMVLVDSPSIPPEWLASITPPVQEKDRRPRANPFAHAKGNVGKAAKAVKAATYKGKGKHLPPIWDAMPAYKSDIRAYAPDSIQDQSPVHLSASPHTRDSPKSMVSNETDGSTTPKSGRFPSPEALFRLLHSPRSRRASADADAPSPGQSSSTAATVFVRDNRQVMTDPVYTRPLPPVPDFVQLPHIEGLPRACEAERQGKGQERWTMMGHGLELSSACFDALGLDIGEAESAAR